MKIFLRPITINDSHLIVKWRNNSTVLSHCMSKIEITEESHLKFFKENIETGKYKQFIVERLDDDLLLLHIQLLQYISKIWTIIISVVNFAFLQVQIENGGQKAKVLQ